MSRRFKKKIEDFTCENCRSDVPGNGYTNHCSKCLWSKHVDVNPGDREEKCGGMMNPNTVLLKHGENIIVHRCVKCGFERKNKVNTDDDFNEIIKLSLNS